MEKQNLNLSKLPKINSWLTELFELLYNNNYSEKQLAILMSQIISYYTKRKNLPIEETFNEEYIQTRFFLYLNSIKEKLTFDYINDAIATATSKQIDSDFIDNFVKYIIVTNLSDIQVSSGIQEGDDYIANYALCLLGPYPLAQMELISTDNGIMFDQVKVKESVRRMGIGTALFKGVIKDMHEKRPGEILYANNVLKQNVKAISFYQSLGAEVKEHNGSSLYVEFNERTIDKIYKKQ